MKAVFVYRLLAVALGILGMLAPSEAAERPNVLFIMSDDHAAHAISSYGGRLADIAPTPMIDRLASEGARFTNAFVTNSICAPSRAVILTGKYSHRNGVYKMTALDQSQPTLPKLLARSGYQTGLVGKWHLRTNPVGFEWWSILPSQGKYHDPEFLEMGDEDFSGIVNRGKVTEYAGAHSTDVITDKALKWLRDGRDPERPFFFMLHYKAPHDKWEHAHRYNDYLADVDVPEPSNLFDHGSGRSVSMDMSLQRVGREKHMAFNERIASLEGDELRRESYQEYMKRYLRCVKGIDDNLARVLSFLDESGLAENTIVIYTADQGFFLGEHGLYDKRLMYEEALRMPLLIRWPGVVEAGSVIDDIVLNLDFPETLLDAAGVGVPEEMQGRSFLPLLKGDVAPDWREAFYYRYYFSHFELPRHFGIRTKTHKLIHFDEIGEWELYDLKHDPQEMNNLARDPESGELLVAMQNQLAILQREVGDDPKDVGDFPHTGNPELDAIERRKAVERQGER